MSNSKKNLSVILTIAMILSSVSVLMSVNAFADTLDIWDGTSKTAPTQGSGTEADPYLVTTPAEFVDAINCGTKGTHYKLTTDIYLNDISKVNWSTGEAIGDYIIRSWSVPGTTVGYFNGNGHMIYGLYINGSGQNAALIKQNYDRSTVQFDNLGMDYVYIKSTHSSGRVSPFVANLYSKNATGDATYLNFDSCFVGENVC